MSLIAGLLNSLLYLYILAVIIWAVLSTLVSFRIVNGYDPLVGKILRFLDGLVQPVLRPIQRVIPPLGGIDISPILLIFLLTFVQQLLASLHDARYAGLAFINLISGLLTLYMWCVFLLAVLGTLISFRMVNLYQPLVQTVMMVLRSLCDPAIQPIRKIIQPIGRLDIAPFILFAALYLANHALWRLV